MCLFYFLSPSRVIQGQGKKGKHLLSCSKTRRLQGQCESESDSKEKNVEKRQKEDEGPSVIG